MGEEESRTQKAPAEVVKPADMVTKSEVAAGSATQTQVLIGEKDGAPNFSLRRFIMGEGGGMPRHTNTVEHDESPQKEVGGGGFCYPNPGVDR